jgi:hypothetical protein
MKTTKTKTPKLKPRRMWANYYDGKNIFPCVHGTRTRAISASAGYAQSEAIPVAVIPLDDVEALVEKAYAAYWAQTSIRDGLRKALVAIGVLPRARKGRK